MQIEKISISCFQLSGNAFNVNARMPVRSQGFFKVMMWYERCTGIVEVKGSNTVQAWFFFRLSFHNCKSCVYTCDDLPSYRTFVCHMHTPIPSPLTERIIAWWAKKKTCVGVVCDKICQKRFHRELSLMLGGNINPTKIPQFEHAACILENFLHGCYENSDLRHWKIQTSWVSRKQRPPENLRPPKNSDPWVSWKLRPFNIFQILQLTIDCEQPLSLFPIYRSEISFCRNISWAKVRTGNISTKTKFCWRFVMRPFVGIVTFDEVFKLRGQICWWSLNLFSSKSCQKK